MTKTSSDSETARFIRHLPPRPDLEKQKKLAKTLMRDCQRGDAQALAMLQHLHPKPPALNDLRLSDAQLVIARSYGFASWPKLKAKIDYLTKTPADLFVDAIKRGDVEAVGALLAAHPDLKSKINDPLFEFGRRAVHVAATRLPMLDLLLANGADINLKSEWHLGGFGILEDIKPAVAAPLIERGAIVDICAASNLGMIDRLKELLAADPSCVNAKGGDGKRPLHYAASVEIAECLLEHGAELDALDDDHQSTPAQHLVGERADVCRFLVERGAKTDLLMAAALGDAGLVRRHLADDPKSIGMRVSQDWFPMIDTAENGGHIYQWTLGFYLSAFDIARKHGHDEVLDILRANASAGERLLEAIRLDDEAAVKAVLAEEPDLIAGGGAQLHRHLVDFARHNDTRSVKMMMSLGFPLDARGQHDATALHFAAFHGNPELVAALLEGGASIDVKDRDYGGTPLGWALHGSADRWPGISMDRHDEAVRLLLDAGSECGVEVYPFGHDAIDAVLKSHLFGN
jgi:ankyrin repeat protein